jgi:hypothetical protein
MRVTIIKIKGREYEVNARQLQDLQEKGYDIEVIEGYDIEVSDYNSIAIKERD